MAHNPIEHLLAPQTAHARQRLVPGLVTAKVKSIEAGGLYRLDYLHMGDGQPSAPARVMMPMAGARRGLHCLPEAGDEVVVAFELGDSNFPIILGSVWNNDSPPPDQAKQSPDNNVRTLVTRSGHELTFDDTAGAEKVTLKTKGGHQLVMDDQPGQGKVTVQTNGGRSLVLDDTPPGSASLQTASGVQIQVSDAGGSLTIIAPTAIVLQSTAITLQAGAIQIITSGSLPTSTLMIDGTPIGMHVHSGGLIAGLTGPVSLP